MSATDCDILIIGGGPAGATAAALLASRGHRVTVLEQAAQPRGLSAESLAPAIVPLLAQLGVAAQVEAIALAAHGMQVIAPGSSAVQRYLYCEAGDDDGAQAWQVPRPRFDEILLDNARARGASVIQSCRVTHLQFRADGHGAVVHARHGGGDAASWNARFVIDASGRESLLGHHFKSRKRQSGADGRALYASFSGALRDDDGRDGERSIFWFEHGWCWSTPLADGSCSVGVLTSLAYQKACKLAPDAFLLAAIARCPLLSARLAQAQMASQVQLRETQACRSEHSSGANYLVLGDAHATLSPLLGCGLLLALHGAMLGADTADRCLRRPAEAAGGLAGFEHGMRAALADLSWFSDRASRPGMQALFCRAPQRWQVRSALVSVLAGQTVPGQVKQSLPALKAWYYLAGLQNRRPPPAPPGHPAPAAPTASATSVQQPPPPRQPDRAVEAPGSLKS